MNDLINVALSHWTEIKRKDVFHIHQIQPEAKKDLCILLEYYYHVSFAYLYLIRCHLKPVWPSREEAESRKGYWRHKLAGVFYDGYNTYRYELRTKWHGRSGSAE